MGNNVIRVNAYIGVSLMNNAFSGRDDDYNNNYFVYEDYTQPPTYDSLLISIQELRIWV